MEYYTLFVITEKGFQWWPSATALVFTLVFLLAARRASRKHEHSGFVTYSCFSALALLLTVLLFGAMFAEYKSLRDAYVQGEYDIAEGEIHDFTPMPKDGRGGESFYIGTRRFSYSDFRLSPAFHQTTYRGGPIREGLYVKVYHRHGKILRIDLRIDPSPHAK